MNSKRVFFIMIGLVVLLAVLNIGAVVAGNFMLQRKSSGLIDLKLESSVLDEQQSSLKQAKKDIEKYSGLQTIAESVVPQDKDQAAAVREIIKIAKDNGITVANISFPASTLGQVQPKATSTDSSNNAAPKTPTVPLTQVQPVEGIKGVYSLQINVQQDTTTPITYAKLISFLTDLEQNRRTAQVTSVSVTPNPSDRSKLTFNLTLITYIKP